jgi:tetratricopeptide (TPR) repeat protein
MMAMLLATAVLGAQDSKHDLAIANLRKGQDALRQEHWKEAEEFFTDAIEYDHLLEMAHYGLGQAFMGEKQYDDAVRAYKGCRDTYVKNATATLSDSVEAERRREDQIQSLRDYKTALQTGRTATMNVMTTLNMIDNQIAQLETMRKRGPNAAPSVAPFISTALGSAYFRKGDYTLAEAEWRNALAVDSKLGEVHNNLAVVCLMTGRVAEAADHVKQAEKAGIRVNPRLKQDIADGLR